MSAFSDDFVTIHHGDAWALAPTLEPQSVHTIVTSPPYWGLRDYGEPGQFGLEPTPEEYVSRLVSLFALLRPALRNDGTVWLNLGDSYARQAGDDSKKATDTGFGERGTGRTGKSDVLFKSGNNRPPTGLKPKDLVGIPWRVAFALQADGWYLRSDIIWHKPNPMPESVTDRPTKAHEYLFLLSKQARYYYDAEAIKEPMTDSSVKRYELAASRILEEEPDRYKERVGVASGAPRHAVGMAFRPKAYKHEGAVRVGREAIANPNRVWTDAEALGTATRNRRSVWTIPTRPFSQAHFAVFPPDLIKPCILAGCPEGGTVLDPFLGSGTTAQVARSLGRKSIGFELNAEYIDIAAKHRLSQGVLL